ncbi:MAG: hypothetical protein AAGJ81_08225 [Verrucomicrobiota bacterium]
MSEFIAMARAVSKRKGISFSEACGELQKRSTKRRAKNKRLRERYVRSAKPAGGYWWEDRD